MARRLAELRKMQRNQLTRINKEEIIETRFSAQDEDETLGLTALCEKLNAVVAEVAEPKKIITSPESFVDKKFVELNERIEKQADITSGQQRFLDSLDRRGREANVMVLGLLDEGEALDGAVTDTWKLEKVWELVGVAGVACQHRRLGAHTEGGRRNRPLLLTIPQKDTRSHILANTKKPEGGWREVFKNL